MPPKTRATKAAKTLKENLTVTNRTNPKIKNKVTKQPRKAFADKTNSPPDEPAAFQPPVKHLKKTNNPEDGQQYSAQRSRRMRRLPTRYEGNNVLKKLSNSNLVSPEKVETVAIGKVTPIKTASSYPTESHLKVIDSPMINVRSKRIQRLPSKFNDHTLSPIKPVQASTPIATLPLKKSKNVDKPIKQKNVLIKEINRNKRVQSSDRKVEGSVKDVPGANNQGNKQLNNDSLSNSKNNCSVKPVQRSTATLSKSQEENANKQIKKSNVVPKATNRNKKVQLKDEMIKESLKNMSDSNNNGCKKINKDSFLIVKTNENIHSNKIVHPKISKQQSHNNSLRLLEGKKPSKRNSSKLDVYEFTFDPNEEPPPAKKKKKRVTKKNPSQSKKVTIKSTYDKNLAKALVALKNSVAAKSSQSTNQNTTKKKVMAQQCTNKNLIEGKSSPVLPISNISNDRQHSMRVEDIALQFQQDDPPINYSPVYSPVKSPVYSPVNSPVYSPVNSPVNCPDARDSPPPCIDHEATNAKTKKDPLNLLDDISFFDEHPVASSSMNCSTRHPLASPWRVEFGSLPIKWPVNAYVKPNMTPAIETSFIDFGENKKKHIYTDMVPYETTDTVPTVVKNTPILKQTSIISFIKEVIDKKANKRKKNKIISNNSVFEDTIHTLPPPHVTPQKHNSPNEISPIKETTPVNVHNTNVLTEQQKSNTPIKNKEPHTNCVSKGSKKKKDKDVTYFGFDESEDQENISPVKENNKIRSLRPRRAVLQEINALKNPEKAVILIAAESKSPSSSADKVFNAIKPATEPPVFTAIDVDGKKSVACANESTETDREVSQTEMEYEDTQSVHLFEDVEIVHYSKPIRKSYGKSKKVTFHHNSNSSDSDVESNKSSDEDNLEDLSFKIPTVKENKITKKKKPKKLMSKKEAKEAEAWAKGFNSMCEDIEEYDLVVE